jgi:hypothetical protein
VRFGGRALRRSQDPAVVERQRRGEQDFPDVEVGGWFDVVAMTPEASAPFFRSEVERCGRLAKMADIKIDGGQRHARCPDPQPAR